MIEELKPSRNLEILFDAKPNVNAHRELLLWMNRMAFRVSVLTDENAALAKRITALEPKA